MYLYKMTWLDFQRQLDWWCLCRFPADCVLARSLLHVISVTVSTVAFRTALEVALRHIMIYFGGKRPTQCSWTSWRVGFVFNRCIIENGVFFVLAASLWASFPASQLSQVGEFFRFSNRICQVWNSFNLSGLISVFTLWNFNVRKKWGNFLTFSTLFPHIFHTFSSQKNYVYN